MSDREPTATERTFFDELSALVPGLHDWYHADPDGTPWMLVSHDFVAGGGIVRTLRADYDGNALRGGWSPANLNWDGGIRAHDAHIDTNPPAGLCHDNVEPNQAATITAQWFATHIAKWNLRTDS
ncbi:hypothetical protein GCM10009804_41900 [Kribbella hippodromi]|uniref:Uncharacterized protein n=1 Tax=Kribbella hippodromi TaxID=434347 RepID=A0ABN2DQ22_9ACTN